MMGWFVANAERLEVRPHVDGHGECMWARVEGQRGIDRLRRFRPVPTMVFREGGLKRWCALWMLDRQLSAGVLWAANERLARRVGGLVRCAETMLVPVGVCGKRGDDPVHVWETPGMYAPDVVSPATLGA